MATPAKRVLDFDQVEDKPEAIKEVEVTPVEDSVQVKKEVVAPAATGAGVVPESGAGAETKLSKIKGQGYSAVTKASMQKQTGPKSAPLTSKASSIGIGTSKRPSTAPISSGRITSKSSTSSVGIIKQDQKSSRYYFFLNREIAHYFLAIFLSLKSISRIFFLIFFQIEYQQCNCWILQQGK